MNKKIDTKSKNNIENSSRVPNMLNVYRNQVISSMVTRFNYKNSMQVPKILSISLNMGIGDAKANSKKLESATKEMGLITGQKPLVTKSKSDIKSNFELKISL